MNYAGDVTPLETFAALQHDPTATLVDVRMPQELSFVGMPELIGALPHETHVPACVTIAGADHMYNGRHQSLSDEIIGWLT